MGKSAYGAKLSLHYPTNTGAGSGALSQSTSKQTSNRGSEGGALTQSISTNAGGGGASSGSSQRHKTPLRKLASDRRMAERILQRYGNTPAEELTAKHSASIEWARKFLEDHPKQKPTAKRQRSQEEVVEQAKRPRPHQSKPAQPSLPAKSYSDIAKTSLILGVIDRSADEGRIPREKWKWEMGGGSTLFRFPPGFRGLPGTPPRLRRCRLAPRTGEASRLC